MIMTNHAIERCRQRRIPEHLLELALEIGAGKKKPGNATSISIGKKELDRLIHEYKTVIHGLERLKRQKLTVITKDNETVITAY